LGGWVILTAWGISSGLAGDQEFDGEGDGDGLAGAGLAEGGFEVAQVGFGLFERTKDAAGTRKRHGLFRLFDHGLFTDDHNDAIFGDVVFLAIRFNVKANLGVLGERDVAVHDGIADAGVAAKIDVVEDDGVFDIAVAVDADVVAQDRELDAAAGDDGAAGDDRIESHAHAIGIGKDKLGGRVLMLPGAQGPGLVVEVEDGRDGDQVHIGFVVGVHGADVAPVGSAGLIFVHKVVGEDAILADEARDDVAAEVVAGGGVFGVGNENGDKELAIEDIHAHRGVGHGGIGARTFGTGGLLFKADDAPVFVGFKDAKSLGRGIRRDFNCSDGDIRPRVGVLLKHFSVIHFINVIARQNHDVARTLAADGVDVLVDGVGGAEIPVGGDAHLRGKDFDEVAEAHDGRPAAADVAIEAEGLVLGEDEDAAEVAINAVREGDVDDAVDAAEGDGGFGAVAGERPEAFALSAGKQDTDGIAHQRHG